MFTNFKVIANMGSPIATTDYIILDSLLSAALAKEILKDNFYNGTNNFGSKEQIDSWLSELLDKKQRVYCTSIGFGGNLENLTSWTKRFDSKNDDLIKFTGKGKQRIDIARGHFKNYHMPLVIKSYKKITFFVRGNKEKIEYLLNNYIFYIGKKGAQGFGEVNKWIIEDIEEDYSLWKDNTPMRPIPVIECDLNLIRNYNIQESSIIPPYWRPDNRELCVIPLIGDNKCALK